MTETPDPALAPRPALDADLQGALDRAADADRLLVALDFDGVLAPEVDDPDDARALPASLAALLALRELPGTTVALVSGRSLESLDRVGGMPTAVPLVGSHGLELRLSAEDAHPAVSAADAERVVALRSRLAPLVARVDGAWIEDKPAGLAVHSRLVANPDDAAALGAAVREAAAAADRGLTVRDGKNVVELSVRDATKGDGLRVLAERFSPDAVLFAGDDVTDEDALAVLGPDDVGIKVGSAPTIAPFRVVDPAAVAAVLEHLLDARRAARPVGRRAAPPASGAASAGA